MLDCSITIHSCSTTDDTMIITNDYTVNISSNVQGGIVMGSYTVMVLITDDVLLISGDTSLMHLSFHI